MSKVLLGTAITATAILMGAAQATPKPATTAPAEIDHVHTICKVTVKDSNGKLVGQRITEDDAHGVVGRVRLAAGAFTAACGVAACMSYSLAR